jgi:hypothetical protein
MADGNAAEERSYMTCVAPSRATCFTGEGYGARRVALAALTGVILGPIGCASTGAGPEAGTPLPTPVQHATLAGIPLPQGFSYVPDRSVFFHSGQIRGGIFEFSGVNEPLVVYKFYQTHMPSAGFTLKQSGGDRGVYTLRFDSEAEECNVKVLKEKAKTVLVIRLDPLPKGAVERDEIPRRARRPTP